MKTFRQLIKEDINEGVLSKLKRKAKDIIGADLYMIIAPKFKRVKPFNPTKEYGIYVDWEEAVAYHDKPDLGRLGWEFFGVEIKQYGFVIDTIEDYATKIEVEIDDKNTFYKFIIGMGYKDDLEAFAKKELRGAPYEIRKANIW